jgi:hypothetical protein
MTAVLVLVGVTSGGLIAVSWLTRTSATVAQADAKPHGAPPAATAKPSAQPMPGASKTASQPGPEAAKAPAQGTSPPAASATPVQGAPPKAAAPPARTETAAPKETKPATPSPPPPAQPAKPATPAPAETKAAETKPAPPKPPAEDAEKRATFAKALADARQAMAGRELARAKHDLDAAAATVQNDADQAQLDRLQILLENLEEFWKNIRAQVAKLQPAEELEVKNVRVAVVEASEHKLTIHSGGRNQSFRIEALPAALLQTIVDLSFAPSPGSKVVVGSFLAIDRVAGDRDRARKLWEEAAKGGEETAKTLLPELDAR